VSARIWVVAQHRDGVLHRGTWEAAAAAQALASQLGGSVEVVVLGHGIGALAAELAPAAPGGVRVVDAAPLADYTAGGYATALAGAIASERPDWVFLTHTYQSCEYVPRVAQQAGAAHLPEAVAFEVADGAVSWRRPVLGGKLQAVVRVRGEGTALVTVQAGAFSADAVARGEAGPVSDLAVDLSSLEPGREILGVEKAAEETVDLSQADAIVAVGRGVGGADKMGPVEELAKLLRAEIGASRPVIDSGWLARDRQIGSSGQTVSPKLYLALGISGAIQHLVGMKSSGCVVAVNKDAGAPIFKVARYGVVGDLHEIVPALCDALREGGG